MIVLPKESHNRRMAVALHSFKICAGCSFDGRQDPPGLVDRRNRNVRCPWIVEDGNLERFRSGYSANTAGLFSPLVLVRNVPDSLRQTQLYINAARERLTGIGGRVFQEAVAIGSGSGFVSNQGSGRKSHHPQRWWRWSFGRSRHVMAVSCDDLSLQTP